METAVAPVIELSDQTILTRNPSITTMMIDDEFACVNEATGACLSFNLTGKMIWDLLDTPLSVQSIMSSFSSTFPDVPTITEDIANFVVNLLALNVVEIQQ